MKFAPGERLDVGCWKDKSLDIAQRYSEAKYDEQASLREELVLIASHALRILALDHKSPSAESELHLSFSEIWKYFPKHRSIELHTCEWQVALDWVGKLFPAMREFSVCTKSTAKFREHVVEESPDDNQSSSSSESSEYTSVDDTASEKEVCVAGDAPEEVEWLLSKGQKGCLHIKAGLDTSLTLCGRTLRLPENGQGMQLALQCSREWSPRCKASLSSQQKHWWDTAHEF